MWPGCTRCGDAVDLLDDRYCGGSVCKNNYFKENSAEKLTREQFARLDVLTHSQVTYKSFTATAFTKHRWDFIYQPAYEHLAQQFEGEDVV